MADETEAQDKSIEKAPQEPEAIQKEKTADRPHRITIYLGLLSPTLAVFAVFISFLTLRTNQRSMRVGQRAYLSASDFNFTRNASYLAIRYTVQNTGNSPARDVTARFLVFPKAQSTPTEFKDKSLKGDIGPKITSVQGGSFTLELLNDPRAKPLELHVELKYSDVFEKPHGTVWCFVMQGDQFVNCVPYERRTVDDDIE